MNTLDTKYLDLVKKILNEGVSKPTRTGINAITIAGHYIEHDMMEGFPLLTTKKVAFKSMKVELEGFIKGIRDKQWFKDRGCTIWNEWCNPKKVKYGNDEASKLAMASENDLGSIYGVQWRAFSDPQNPSHSVDQLKSIVDKLKTNPNDRRMICSAWNPLALDEMALPPCHMLWQVVITGNELNLSWTQRSVDTALGLPFNISSYALLLQLLAGYSGFRPGKLIGFLSDVHIYENQVEAMHQQLDRTPYAKLPSVLTSVKDDDTIFDWTHDKTILCDYECHPSISIPLAV